MNADRRSFLKSACVASSCICGLSALGSNSQSLSSINVEQQSIMHEWISTLMLCLDENTDDELSRKIMKRCAKVHFDELKMDEVLLPYEGDLPKFIRFLEESWNWKVFLDSDKRIIHADENKNYCVCPMVDKQKGVKSGVLCYCSEGFAELMFSKVVGNKVNAIVVSSILRGDDRCKYQINL